MRNEVILVILSLLIEKMTLLLFSGILFVVFYLYFGSTMTEPQNQIETYVPLVSAGLYTILLTPFGVLIGYGLNRILRSFYVERLKVSTKLAESVNLVVTTIALLPGVVLLFVLLIS